MTLTMNFDWLVYKVINTVKGQIIFLVNLRGEKKQIWRQTDEFYTGQIIIDQTTIDYKVESTKEYMQLFKLCELIEYSKFLTIEIIKIFDQIAFNQKKYIDENFELYLLTKLAVENNYLNFLQATTNEVDQEIAKLLLTDHLKLNQLKLCNASENKKNLKSYLEQYIGIKLTII